eukprot:scaffold9202_cov94-Isochrysis_galbana.AAC.1
MKAEARRGGVAGGVVVRGKDEPGGAASMDGGRSPTPRGAAGVADEGLRKCSPTPCQNLTWLLWTENQNCMWLEWMPPIDWRMKAVRGPGRR